MYGAVKTHKFQAPVGLSLTVPVTERHYYHRVHIWFGAKLALYSLLFNFCTSSFTQVFILTRKYTITCGAKGFLEEGVELTQYRREISLASWETFKMRLRVLFLKIWIQSFFSYVFHCITNSTEAEKACGCNDFFLCCYLEIRSSLFRYLEIRS